MKGTASERTRFEEPIPVVSQGEAQEDHKGRKERAVKEREEKVKAELGRLKTNIERSKIVSSKVEGEGIFMCATLPAFSLNKAFKPSTISQDVADRCNS